MESSVGVGDVLRLFYETGHEHYLVSDINYDNEIMLRGRDGVEELLPTENGRLSAFDGHAIVGFQIVRQTPKEFPKGSEVAVDLQTGQRLRGEVKSNDDGILEIKLESSGIIFVDVSSPNPLVKSVALYADTATEAEDPTEITEFGSETELVDMRAKIKQAAPAEAARTVQSFKELRGDYTDKAAGVYVRSPLLLSALALPKWIFPLLEENYLKILPNAGRKAKAVQERAFFNELTAALKTQQYFHHYQTLFDALCPFVTPARGRDAEVRVQAISIRQQVFRRTAPVFMEVFVPAVAGEAPEQVEFDEFAVIPEAMAMARIFLPSTPLYDRCLMHPNLAAYHALIRRRAPAADPVTDLARVWENQTATIFPNVHDTVRSLEPYLCYARDVTVAAYKKMLPNIALKVAQVKGRFKNRAASSPSSTPAHVFPDKYDWGPAYSTEMLAKMLAFDQGRRLLNHPERPAAGKRSPAKSPTALEVLPEKIVEMFNAYFTQRSNMALVDAFGREATPTESADWLYFRPDDMLNHKFMPVLVERLLRARHNKGLTGYLGALEQLKKSNRTVVEDNLVLDRGSGYALAPADPVTLDRGAALVRDAPRPAYTQSDLAILSVVKAVADPYKLRDKYEYVIQHVRGLDRPEEVVYAVCAYAALFAHVDAESVANSAAESVNYGRGKYWGAVKTVGPGAILSKIKEKMVYLARDYEFVRLNRQAEIQSGIEWPSFFPQRHSAFADQAPITPEDQLHVYPAQMVHYFRNSKERAPEMQAKLAFLESVRRPRTAETTAIARPAETVEKIDVDLFDEEVPEKAPAEPYEDPSLADPKRAALDAATVWGCEGALTPPPADYIEHLAPHAGLHVLADFVQNAALTWPTLVSRGRARQAVKDPVHLDKKSAAHMEKKLNEYYSPLLGMSASASAEDFFKRQSERKPLGDNELSDQDAETTFVRTYLHRQADFRALVQNAQAALEHEDEGVLKACATRALALHLSDPPLEYECRFVHACVRMFQTDAASWSEQSA